MAKARIFVSARRKKSQIDSRRAWKFVCAIVSTRITVFVEDIKLISNFFFPSDCFPHFSTVMENESILAPVLSRSYNNFRYHLLSCCATCFGNHQSKIDYEEAFISANRCVDFNVNFRLTKSHHHHHRQHQQPSSCA